jgi:hypothetical protein
VEKQRDRKEKREGDPTPGEIEGEREWGKKERGAPSAKSLHHVLRMQSLQFHSSLTPWSPPTYLTT